MLSRLNALRVGLFSLLLIGACPAVSWEVIESGTGSGIKTRLNAVVTSDKEWQTLWTKHCSYVDPAPPLPVVDFKKNTVIAVFSGNKNSGGHSIAVSRICQKDNMLIVNVVEKAPTAGALTTQMITQPYQLIKVAGAKRAATFSGF